MNPPPTGPLAAAELCLVVYAPFGDDVTLSRYPDQQPVEMPSFALVESLRGVAAAGVPVLALVDRPGEASHLLHLDPSCPGTLQMDASWKLDMAASFTLTGLLQEARRRYPDRRLVLSIEGHGAGYLPAIDKAGLLAMAEQGVALEWRHSATDQAPFDSAGRPYFRSGVPTLPGGSPTLPGGSPTLPGGSPTLPGGSPTLPGGSPTLPVGHASMPTYALGQALKAAMPEPGQRLAVIHLANCFNLSVEVLHTVAPYAEVASGYSNANFFTGGSAYPAVFGQLAAGDIATTLDLARAFVHENHRLLQLRGRHPIVGGALALSRMDGIASALDRLADALLRVLRSTLHPRRARKALQAVIAQAQQYDTNGDIHLDGPDQLTDLFSLAQAMAQSLKDWPGVEGAALDLCALLRDIKCVGDVDVPWTDPSDSVLWDFSAEALAMNIFLPDPLRSGIWDWRTPFYMDINPGQGTARLQTGAIDFLKETTWVEFIQEYHRDTLFRAFSVPGLPWAPPARSDTTPLSAEHRARLRLQRAQAPRRTAPAPGPIGRQVEQMQPKSDEIDD